MIGRGDGIYFSHPSGGPCWSRDLGYHTPDPIPVHIMDIITAPSNNKKQAAAKRKKSKRRLPVPKGRTG